METPRFDEALSQFVGFIHSQGLSADLTWAFREDISNCGRSYWVRVPTPAGNSELARGYYEHGRRAGLGVTLSVLCRVGDHLVCYVWVPEDAEAACYAMQGPLKLQMPSPLPEARPIRSGVIWLGLLMLNRWRRCVTFSDLLPSREAVRA